MKCIYSVSWFILSIYEDGTIFSFIKLKVMSQPDIRHHQQKSRIIDQLRKKGYVKIFCPTNDRSLICDEDQNCFGYDVAMIRLVEYVYDDLMKCENLLFTVETPMGHKGIMTLPNPGIKLQKPLRSKSDIIEAFWMAL
jgi:hypothetical protein